MVSSPASPDTPSFFSDVMRLEIPQLHVQGSPLICTVFVQKDVLYNSRENAEVALKLETNCVATKPSFFDGLLDCPKVEGTGVFDSEIVKLKSDGTHSQLRWSENAFSYFSNFLIELPAFLANDVLAHFFLYPSDSTDPIIEEFSIFVAPAPQFYFHQSGIESIVEFTLWNQSTKVIAVEEVLLSFGDEESRVYGFPCEIEPMSSTSSSFSIDEFETLMSHLEILTEKKSVKIATFAKVKWTIEEASSQAVYRLPVFQTFAKKLIVTAEVVSEPPHVTNKLLKVRYSIMNQLIDFKKVCLKWAGCSSIYCVDPWRNFGKMDLNSESVCYVKFYPTQTGLIDFGGESLRLDLQFSPTQRIQTECVLKKSLFLEIIENAD